MKKLLFVDEKPNALQGLQQSLQHLQPEWGMEVVTSGTEALDVLTDQSFDVVISDMQLPGMTGAQLLNRVYIRHPNIVRVLLSEESERENLQRSTGPTNQYLSKPCNATLLECTVTRACELRAVLSSELLRNCMSQMKTLPSMPKIYSAIVEQLNDPESSARDIGETIRQDIGMTAKILQLVNSALFGCPRRISDPVQAVGILGLHTIKSLVLSHSVFSQFTPASSPHFSFDALWQHSLQVASLARQIARSQEQERSIIEDAFTGGLLHDVGQLALATNMTTAYNTMLQCVKENHLSLLEAEKETFGATHAEVGAYLMEAWNLPHAVVEAIAFHHHPLPMHGTQFTPLTAVYIANALVREANPGTQASAIPALDREYLGALDLTCQLDYWRSLCQS